MEKTNVFSHEWFKKYQRQLLWLLNTPFIRVLFRWFLRITEQDCKRSVCIAEIFPNGFTIVNSFDDETLNLTTDFRTNNKFALRLYHAFKPLWYTLHFFDWLLMDRYQPITRYGFGFSTLTQYPGTIGTQNPLSGFITLEQNAAWNTLVTATDGSDQNAGSTLDYGIWAEVKNAGVEKITRSFHCFNTAALTSSATVTAGTLSVVVAAKVDQDNDAQGYVNIYLSTLPSTSAFTAGFADYDQIGSTAQATAVDITGITADGSTYTDWTLNSTGYGNISKTGITQFGMREGHDAENSAPAGNTFNAIQFYFGENSGTSVDPKLVVTYTVPVASIISDNLLLLGVS